jgi:hypothetical protein
MCFGWGITSGTISMPPIMHIANQSLVAWLSPTPSNPQNRGSQMGRVRLGAKSSTRFKESQVELGIYLPTQNRIKNLVLFLKTRDVDNPTSMQVPSNAQTKNAPRLNDCAGYMIALRSRVETHTHTPKP